LRTIGKTHIKGAASLIGIGRVACNYLREYVNGLENVVVATILGYYAQLNLVGLGFIIVIMKGVQHISGTGSCGVGTIAKIVFKR